MKKASSMLRVRLTLLIILDANSVYITLIDYNLNLKNCIKNLF